MKAIDLYSGIGGWTLGFELAGIDIVASYEWWSKANRTHNKNTQKKAVEMDIRKLNVEDLPQGVDIVVGSPPCTQFSFANRGGNGDIADGLKDIKKFLDVVSYLKPKYWAMENVPRVSKIIEKETQAGGQLEQYRELFTVNEVIDMSQFGVPQRRKRMIAGNFPIELLNSYQPMLKELTMGEVLQALSEEKPRDLLYGISISQNQLTDNQHEEFLNDEELRINSDSKTCHPVYNKMAFPDHFNRPVRTITATCTRVSRESIIIEDIHHANAFRRLSVRERGLLQGFPITYQFFGDSHAEKLKMIGNAVPPAFTYYLANAMQEVSKEALVLLEDRGGSVPITEERPKRTQPSQKVKNFQPTRKFRAAVPTLRFGSGVRFDLSNHFDSDKNVHWRISFYYGSSKKIQELVLSKALLESMIHLSVEKEMIALREAFSCELNYLLEGLSAEQLQSIWIHQEEGVSPYEVVDFLDVWAVKLYKSLESLSPMQHSEIVHYIESVTYKTNKKLGENALWVLVGLWIGIEFNATNLNQIEESALRYAS